MPSPGFEPGSSRPQREVLTPILWRPGDIGYRSRYLSHAKRALYHLSYIPYRWIWCHKVMCIIWNYKKKQNNSYVINSSLKLKTYLKSVQWSVYYTLIFTLNFLSQSISNILISIYVPQWLVRLASKRN